MGVKYVFDPPHSLSEDFRKIVPTTFLKKYSAAGEKILGPFFQILTVFRKISKIHGFLADLVILTSAQFNKIHFFAFYVNF